MPLMTYDEYQKNRHSTPYGFSLQSGSNHLYYFGEKHSFDPDHPQWIDNAKYWQKFLKETERLKRIVFIEGGRRDTRKTIEESILLDGGMGHITYLAAQAGIETYSAEPDEKYERSELEKQFTREEIQYYYFARVVLQWSRKTDPRPDFEKYIGRFLEGDKEESGWEDFDFSLEAMRKIHKDMFKTDFDMNDQQFFYDTTTPVELNTVVNKVSRASSEIRDRYIVEKICEYMGEGYSIFAQYGATHAVMQEPLLREML